MNGNISVMNVDEPNEKKTHETIHCDIVGLDAKRRGSLQNEGGARQ